MWLDRVLNLGPLALESDGLPTVLHGPTFLRSNTSELTKHLEVAKLKLKFQFGHCKGFVKHRRKTENNSKMKEKLLSQHFCPHWPLSSVIDM